MVGPNKYQQEANDQTDGPVSGKTFTLVERIIQNKRVEPESLFVVTFTEKAAQELTTRISNRLLDLGIKFNLNEMFLGTFHSICLRIIEDYREYSRLKRSFVLMEQLDELIYRTSYLCKVETKKFVKNRSRNFGCSLF